MGQSQQKTVQSIVAIPLSPSDTTTLAKSRSWHPMLFQDARLGCGSVVELLRVGKDGSPGELHPKCLVFLLAAQVGKVCDYLQWRTDEACDCGLQEFKKQDKAKLAQALAGALAVAVRLADLCGINLPQAIAAKILLNGQKYPAKLSRGSESKYTSYGAETGYIEGAKQHSNGASHLRWGASPWSLIHEEDTDVIRESTEAPTWYQFSLEGLRSELAAFARERDWDQFHTPRNLALALSGEVGELCECFAAKTDAECSGNFADWRTEDLDGLAQEICDVVIYMVRFSDKCGVDLAAEYIAAIPICMKRGLESPIEQVISKRLK